jgi:NodT family efflux transporter outer membrane factor (OMF) lipoprotein
MSISANVRGWTRSALVGALAGLAGCAVGPNFKRPAPPHANQYDAAIAETDAQGPRISEGAVSADWWRLFGSDALDALVVEGLRASPTLQKAQAELAQSRDQVRAGAGVFYPSLSADLGAGRQLASPARFGVAGPGSQFNLFTLSSTLTYALDLFGGQRRTVESLRAASDRQSWQVGSAYLSLTGSIVDGAIAASAYDSETAALKEIVRLDEVERDAASSQASTGVDAYSTLYRVSQQLESDRQALDAAEQKDASARRLLKMLTGREPGEGLPAEPTAFDHLEPPVDAPVSLPAQLVRNRPDIRASEAALHQASAQIGVATAALFPSISLSATDGLESTAFSTLGAAQSRFWSYGVSADAPLFDGGARWFQRNAAKDAYRAALADYRQTVLAALQQTADALGALRSDAVAVRSAQAGMEAAAQGKALAEDNVEAGVSSVYDAVEYELAYQRARLVYVQAKAQELQDVVSLYLASGGGWRGQGTGAP